MRIATVVFTYNRPIHTAKTLTGLRNNSVLPEKLYIFHDGMKASTIKSDWEEVELVISNIDWCDCTVVTSSYNKGLASSVVDGVNSVLKKFDAVIVLEDDCVPHRLFMEYMTKALITYREAERVYSIGAWAEPTKVPNNGYDAYFVGRICSCGWATWKEKWNSFSRDYDLVKQIKKDDDLNRWLNIWGQDLEATIQNNITGEVDTWAAFWALSVILHKGLSLSPFYSLVENIGYDGTGRHSGSRKIDNKMLEDIKGFKFPKKIEVVDDYEKIFANYHRYTEPVIREKYYKNVMAKWVYYLRQGKDITDWLEANGIKKILIWGLGNVGKQVIKALESKVEIAAIIESDPTQDYYGEIPVIKYTKLLEHYNDKYEYIVVVPGYDIGKIKKLLGKKFEDKTIGIDALLQPVLSAVEDSANIKWIGSDYGGYYICSDIMAQSPIIYSFGIGEDISFDLGMISTYQADIYAFDPTPKAKAFVEKEKSIEKDRFHFYEFGLSDRKHSAKFHLPKNKDHVSGSEIMWEELRNEFIEVEMMDIYTIAKELGHKKIDILKMDIEGSEFDVIDNLRKTNMLTIDQICFESHHRFFNDGILRLEKMDKKLNELGYVLTYFSDDYMIFNYVLRSKLEKNDSYK